MNPDVVYTLVRMTSEYRQEEFLLTSKNIYEILDKMFNVGYCNIEDFRIYITDFNNNSIPYKEWRNEK